MVLPNLGHWDVAQRNLGFLWLTPQLLWKFPQLPGLLVCGLFNHCIGAVNMFDAPSTVNSNAGCRWSCLDNAI